MGLECAEACFVFSHATQIQRLDAFGRECLTGGDDQKLRGPDTHSFPGCPRRLVVGAARRTEKQHRGVHDVISHGLEQLSSSAIQKRLEESRTGARGRLFATIAAARHRRAHEPRVLDARRGIAPARDDEARPLPLPCALPMGTRHRRVEIRNSQINDKFRSRRARGRPWERWSDAAVGRRISRKRNADDLKSPHDLREHGNRR